MGYYPKYTRYINNSTAKNQWPDEELGLGHKQMFFQRIHTNI
jgi:hypothetical protein